MVEIVPLLDPIVRRPSGLNHKPSRDVLFMAMCQELEELKPLLAIKLDTKGAVRHKLSRTISVWVN